MRFPISVFSAALIAVAGFGCGGSDEQPQDASNLGPCPPGQFCNSPAPTATQPYPAGTTPPPAGTTPAPGGASAGGSTATPIAPAAAAALTPVLQAMAAQEVKGMQPEGGAFAGQFQEGQILEQPFTVQAGKCYSVVGASIGIQELDVQIVAHQAPLPPVTLAQDQGTGGTAVLGGGGSCWKNPTPLSGPAKIVVRATRGSGMAAAQLFVK